MSEIPSYEEIRRRNIADNKRVLAELGLLNPFKSLPKITLKKSGLKRKADSECPRPKKRPLLEQNVDHSTHGSLSGLRRRSARLQGSDTPTKEELTKEVEDWLEDDDTPKRVAPNRPNFYGAVEGVDVGTVWLTRMECCRDGIHRPTVAGIHGGYEGAYSIALSGGYDDNIDLGECFTYTGEGGRDLKGTANKPKNLRTAPQSKDQTLTRGNLALSRNVETGHPVRVIRGYKLTGHSQFAPEEGYRYDGLYTVQKAWYTTGVSGYKVWKFALKRCENQAPPPWTFAETLEKDSTTAQINNNNENKPNLNEKETADEVIEKENKDETKSVTDIKQQDEAKSMTDKQQDETKSVTDIKQQDEAKSMTEKQQDETKSMTDKQQDETKSVTDKQQDETKSMTDKQQDETKSMTDKQQDETKSVTDKQQDETKSMTDKQQDETKSMTDKQQDETKSMTDKQQDETKSVTDKQDETKSVTDEQQDKTKSVTDKQQDETRSVTDEQPTESSDTDTVDDVQSIESSKQTENLEQTDSCIEQTKNNENSP